jgi:hypothetical protein
LAVGKIIALPIVGLKLLVVHDVLSHMEIPMILGVTGTDIISIFYHRYAVVKMVSLSSITLALCTL